MIKNYAHGIITLEMKPNFDLIGAMRNFGDWVHEENKAKKQYLKFKTIYETGCYQEAYNFLIDTQINQDSLNHIGKIVKKFSKKELRQMVNLHWEGNNINLSKRELKTALQLTMNKKVNKLGDKL